MDGLVKYCLIMKKSALHQVKLIFCVTIVTLKQTLKSITLWQIKQN